MPMTDAQRKANRKWDSANYAAVTCKPRKEVTEQFRDACRTNGTSPNAVLVSAIEFYNRDPEGFRAVQDLAGPFLAACDALNLSPAAVFQTAMENTISQHGTVEPDQQRETI